MAAFNEKKTNNHETNYLVIISFTNEDKVNTPFVTPDRMDQVVLDYSGYLVHKTGVNN